MKNKLPAHAALFCVNLIYGANYLVAKGLMPRVIGPSGFILLRVAGATALFWLLIATINREKIARKDWIRVALCGLFGVASNQLLFFNGLNLTSPVNASVIMTCTPVLVVAFSWLMTKQKLSLQKLVGVFVGLVGAWWLIIHRSGAGYSHSNPLGDLMIFLNATSYGLYLVLVKPLMVHYRPLTVISRVFLVGFIIVLPFGFSQFEAVSWQALSRADIEGILFVVLGTTFLAYLLNIYALKTVSAGAVSTYIYLQPVLTLILAYLYARIDPTASDYSKGFGWVEIICTLAVFIGVYLVSFPLPGRKSRIT